MLSFARGALGWARKAAQAVFDLVRRYPLQAALIALLCLSGWLWQGKRAALADRDEWKAAHSSIVEQYATAQAEAARRAKDAKEAAEARYKALAERTDDELDQTRASLRIALERYAAANQLWPKGNRGSSCGPVAPAEDRSPEGPDGPGAGPELLAISREDFDVLNDNTARLLAAHEWAKSLNLENDNGN